MATNPLVYLAIGAGGLYLYKRHQDKKARAKEQAAPAQLGAPGPNAATAFCGVRGGVLEIRTDEQGRKYGVCVFPDGREVEQWAFYRGEAEPAFPPGQGGGGELPAPCLPPHDPDAAHPYDVVIERNQPVRLCDLPAAATVATTTKDGLVEVPAGEVVRDGDSLSFPNPGFYTVMGGGPNKWGIVVEAVPWLGAPLPGGPVDQPVNVVGYPFNAFELEGLEQWGDNAVIGWGGEGPPEFKRVGGLIQFLNPGIYAVAGPGGNAPIWKITILEP